ncbi:hypothetical protein [Bradyrhizobium sp. DASA03120]|uniref:hypothetical protein n=1 Tax=Bradyrhizobium sp. SMVTL-02 TaxID=3395917 RepID=UPI003F704859
MNFRKRYELVLAVHFQSRGFAFVLFEGWLSPVDWGVYEPRGTEKNARCLDRFRSLLELHTPDILLLQDMSDRGTSRAKRIRELNRSAAEFAEKSGMLVRAYSRAQVIECFEELGAVTKHRIAETIANHIPALDLSLPPTRRSWMSEDARMGIFDAAALAWLFFQSIGKREGRAKE